MRNGWEFFRSVARVFGFKVRRRRPLVIVLPPNSW
jgi:hypothetical protein